MMITATSIRHPWRLLLLLLLLPAGAGLMGLSPRKIRKVVLSKPFRVVWAGGASRRSGLGFRVGCLRCGCLLMGLSAQNAGLRHLGSASRWFCLCHGCWSALSRKMVLSAV